MSNQFTVGIYGYERGHRKPCSIVELDTKLSWEATTMHGLADFSSAIKQFKESVCEEKGQEAIDKCYMYLVCYSNHRAEKEKELA